MLFEWFEGQKPDLNSDLMTTARLSSLYSSLGRLRKSADFHSKTRLAFISLMALLGGCGSLNSGSSDTDFDRRLYVGGGLLVSELEPDADSNPVYSVAETRSSGGSLMVGYDISNRFSVEGQVASLGAAEMNPSGEIDYKTGGLSAVIYGLNDRADRDHREGFSVFGRGGVGYMKNKSTDDVPYEQLNEIHVLFGAGVEYGFESGLGVRAELVSEDTDAKYAQLAVLYRFGDTRDSRADTRTVDIREPAPAADITPSIPEPEPVVTVTDNDQDGVEDTMDQCPNTAPSTPVNSVGCDFFNGVIEGVNFETGSDRLTSEAIDILSSVADTLNRFPDVRVTIEAHTDNQGSAASNLNLSKRRAISVARYLVSRGVQVSRLRPMAFGESRPRVGNDTSSGRAMNRRVEFKVIQ